MAHQRAHREPGDLEVGVNDIFIEHQQPHVPARPAPPKFITHWEAHRPRWMIEMLAEAFGVFLYCWGGMSATAAMMLAAFAKEEGFGSLLTVALCYGLAIAMAVTFVGTTSGAHLSPAFTLAFATFKGFPWRKVPHYIIAQLLGGFIAGLVVWAQFNEGLNKVRYTLDKLHMTNFSPSGAAGAVALYQPPGVSLGIVFLNEFVCCFVMGICVFCILDPSNVFIAPTNAPLFIGLIFFVMVACFASNGIALNTARDLGGRLAMGVIFGKKAFPARYTALAALTNIVGTLSGCLFQILVLSDTIRPPTEAALAAHRAQTTTEAAHLERQLTTKANGEGFMGGGGIGRILSSRVSGNTSEKTSV